MGLQFQVHMVQEFNGFDFNHWSNNCSSRDCCKVSGLWVCLRKCVFSAKWNQLPSSRVLYFLPADTLCLNNASSQTLVNWIFSSSDSKSWMFSCKLLPNASFGGDAKSFTSCDFTHVNASLVTDSCGFSCPFSSSVKPNCSHQFETAP